MNMKCAVIYMAAGNSRRFSAGMEAGRRERSCCQEMTELLEKQDREEFHPSLHLTGNKLLYPLEGKSLYRHGLDTAEAVVRRHKGSALLVITQYPEIYREVEQLGIPVYLNPSSRLGASYTVKRGLEEASGLGEFDYYLFMTGDQPYLSRETLECFFIKGAEGRYAMISASFGERLGNPVMFHRQLYQELMNLKNDEGGRRVWKRYAAGELHTALVQASAERELKDFDLPEDFWQEQER